VNSAQSSKDFETLLLQAQKKINEFLPEEGLVVPEVELEESEEAANE
jgi:hypothetical protein